MTILTVQNLEHNNEHFKKEIKTEVDLEIHNPTKNIYLTYI